MNDFVFHNADKVYFGTNQMSHLPEELLKFGTKALLVYGGGSITGPKELHPADVEDIYRACL